MRKSVLVLAAALALAGCVSHSLEQRQAELAPLVGQSEADLVRQFGVPTRTIEADGHRFLAYVAARTDVLPGAPVFYPSYGFHRFGYGGFGYGGFGAFGPAFPPQVVESVCETTFEIVAGHVAGFSLRGNAC